MVSPLRDKVILYNNFYDPAVTGAIAAGNTFDLATLDAEEHVFIIEEAHVYSPYNLAGNPADLDSVRILIDGEPFPASPSRLYIRAQAERCMAVPYDSRFNVKTIKFGDISTDPLEDTTLKITPAQRLSVRLEAGTVTGVLATDTVTRVMLLGRVADSDEQLRDVYGGATMYGPGAPVQLGDKITGKVTPPISKSFPLTIDNVKRMSGATAQNAPKITPFWTWGQNSGVIPATPEYEWTFRNPANVARAFEEMSFDWTRLTTDRAMVLKYWAAYIAAGAGSVWWHQTNARRPGHGTLFNGRVIDAGFPQMLPGGGAPAATGMYTGPTKMTPGVLAYDNLTELRVVADAGTTILANNLEMQMWGTHIEF